MAHLNTIPGLLDRSVAGDPARPLLTFYDDTTSERTELSGATLANWVAKTANMIVDGSGLGPGDVAAVGLPPHWQTAAVLLGCWSAALEVTGVNAETADIAFVSVDRATRSFAPDQYVLGLHPLGLPLPNPPGGFADFSSEVRTYGDHFRPSHVVVADDPALSGRTHADVAQAAAAWAVARGLTGGRVLIDVDQHPEPEHWLLAPLTAGASVVLCRSLDRTRLEGRVAAERVDLVIG